MRDQATEQWLTAVGATWTYVEVLEMAAVSELDTMAFQTRQVPELIELVDRYADDMAAGDVFPPVLARREGDSYALLGGVHRWRAAARTETRLSAYVVECDVETALAIAVEDNRRHGVPLDGTERIAQAVRFVNDQGWSIFRASRTAGVGVGKLRAHLAAGQFDIRVKRLGVSARQLSATARARLAEVHDDETFIAAVHLASDAQLTTGDVSALVAELTRAETKAAMSAVMTRNQGQYASKIRRLNAPGPSAEPVRRDARSALIRLLYEVTRSDPGDIARCTTAQQRPELRTQLQRAAARLIDIDTVLR